jgi:hypothetical protein
MSTQDLIIILDAPMPYWNTNERRIRIGDDPMLKYSMTSKDLRHLVEQHMPFLTFKHAALCCDFGASRPYPVSYLDCTVFNTDQRHNYEFLFWPHFKLTI